ncbi:hypothetical protein GP486_003385 [Trichoglossum hirsutum]|uniref:C2H2-type domain-containing protein n=1 Tax=Trichoglossum hirsutum TaxID=265104 RepID=A0A9P8LDB6_9PEZI|nr:hypothetical protein GP486_003385 [Trichoglossum hirsutum]
MDAQDSEKASRILEWIALAKRPMKKIELLDGVTLHRGNSQLNEKTRLWERVIDVCKPLVEDGPNGTVVFIHFTVQEYLLKLSPNISDDPIVKPVDAHHDISFACIAYLRTALDLIDPNIPEEQKMVQVAMGFHALQLYASEHWITHLLEYADFNGDLKDKASQPLMEQLASLYTVHEDMRVQLSRTPNTSAQSHAAGDVTKGLLYLSNIEAGNMVRQTVGLRKLLLNKQHITGQEVEAFEMAQDSTLFTEVLLSYKKIVHYLLEVTLVPGLDREQLARFKQHYGPSAFVCHFRGCPRATDGYSTELKLRDHETRVHAGGIKCSEMSCSWNRIGFNTSAALKRHMQKYHSTLESGKKSDVSVVRRKYICGNSKTSNGDSWGCGQRFVLESELQRHFESAAGQICIAEKSSRLPTAHDDLPGRPELQHTTADRVSEKSVQDVGNFLNDLNIDDVPPEYKREGDGWFAIFNPNVPRVLDVDLVHTLLHDSVVCCVRFSGDGKYIATGCNHAAQIFDISTGVRVSYLGHMPTDGAGDLYVRGVCFSPDGKYLATGAGDRFVRLWDIKAKTIRHAFSGHEQDVYALDFARNGRIIASASSDRTVRLWDLDSGLAILVLAIDDGFTSVAISPDARLVAAGSLDKSLRVWDVINGSLVQKYDGHCDSVYSIAFAPNGRELISASLDKTIMIWKLPLPLASPDIDSIGGVRTFKGHKGFVLAVDLTPDGQWTLSGSKDRSVQFWDSQSGSAQLAIIGHKSPGTIFSLCWLLVTPVSIMSSHDSEPIG